MHYKEKDSYRLEKSCTQGICSARNKFPRNKFTGEQIPSYTGIAGEQTQESILEWF